MTRAHPALAPAHDGRTAGRPGCREWDLHGRHMSSTNFGRFLWVPWISTWTASWGWTVWAQQLRGLVG